MSGAPIQKPPKRGPKPRKPIKRSSKPIARKSRPAPVRRSESGRAKSAADREWSRAVRAKGPCAALGNWETYRGVSESGANSVHYLVHRECFGRIDPAHIQSRRYLATRHDVSNGLPLCRFIHDWFGRHPEEFEAFVRTRIGDAEYERLRLKAIQGPKQSEEHHGER